MTHCTSDYLPFLSPVSSTKLKLKLNPGHIIPLSPRLNSRVLKGMSAFLQEETF